MLRQALDLLHNHAAIADFVCVNVIITPAAGVGALRPTLEPLWRVPAYEQDLEFYLGAECACIWGFTGVRMRMVCLHRLLPPACRSNSLT